MESSGFGKFFYKYLDNRCILFGFWIKLEGRIGGKNVNEKNYSG